MREFLRDENGQGMVEYALIIALVSIIAIVALRALGNVINDNFENVNDELGDTAPDAAP